MKRNLIRLRYYWLIPLVEVGLFLLTRLAWTQQTVSWRDWATKYLAQPTPDFAVLGVLNEPFLPLMWVAICGGLVTLMGFLPFLWHRRVKYKLIKLCPICSSKLIRRDMVVEVEGQRVRLERVCPKCNMGVIQRNA